MWAARDSYDTLRALRSEALAAHMSTSSAEVGTCGYDRMREGHKRNCNLSGNDCLDLQSAAKGLSMLVAKPCHNDIHMVLGSRSTTHDT